MDGCVVEIAIFTRRKCTKRYLYCQEEFLAQARAEQSFQDIIYK